MELFNVLIVEDDEVNAKILQNLLLEKGYAVIGVVATAEGAIGFVESRKPDIIIMDIMLVGGLTGIDAVRIIKEKNDIPIIYLTEGADNDIVNKSKETQPAGYLIKPFSHLQLEITMEMVVKKIKADRELKKYQQYLEHLVVERTRELLAEVKMHKDARQYAIENELKLSVITKAANDAIILFDEFGRIIFWNTAAESMFKYPQDEMLNQNIRILFSSDNDNGEFAKGLEVIQSAIDRKYSKNKVELIATRADGVELTVEMSIANVDIEGDSNVVCIVRDISQRKAYVKEISRFKLIADLANYGLAITDADGYFVYANRYFTNLVDYTSDDIIGNSFFNIAPNYKKEELIKYVNEASNLSGGEGREVVFENKLKEEIPVLINSVIIRGKNDVPEFYTVSVIDIRGRKSYEENLLRAKKTAEESDRMKTAFLSTISHELRTPLNAIIGFSELMRTSVIEEEDIKDFNDEIYKSGHLLLSIVEDILDISMLESKTLKVIPKDFSLNNLMEKLHNKFSNNEKYIGKNIAIEWVGDLKDGEDTFLADKSKIEQIFVKLIDNAFKFSEKGTVEFGYVFDEMKNNITFYVKDDGMGIVKSKLNDIFVSFKQVDDGKTRAHDGLGLGLSIVSQLIELMEGTIDIISKPNKGTIFKFLLNNK